jgi:NitT/TauT family transport system permease protein
MMRAAQLRRILLPVLSTVILIVVWNYATQWFDVPSYLIPSPWSVLLALKSGLVDGVLWPHIWATTKALVLGYLLGCAAALVTAAVIAESRILEEATYPLIVAFQSVPKVALAPVLIVWFGFELESKVVMVALICFFPAFLNALIGLKSFDPNLVDLYRAFGASRLQIFLSVKVPSATGAIFAGLEISIVLALLGVVVSELVAARLGLGHVIAASGVDFNVAMMFACVVILSAMGVIASQIILAIHRRVAFWERRPGASVAQPANAADPDRAERVRTAASG